MQLYTKQKCSKEYQKELGRQLHPYEGWIAVHEGQSLDEASIQNHERTAYRVFQIGEGTLHPQAQDRFNEAFQNDATVLVYGDEDVLSEGGKRSEPWFKPDWSPDTLTSHFYFGNVVAIRSAYCGEMDHQVTRVTVEEAYERVVAVLNRCLEEKLNLRDVVVHIPSILFHGITSTTMLGMEPSYRRIKERLLYNNVRQTGRERLGAIEDINMVSIIIPSKDNSVMLERCILSIQNYTEGLQYDITVIDNGSCEDERLAVEALGTTYGFTYRYEPMVFNFARMCNLGASHTKGKLILFLNDDIEFIEQDTIWKLLMVARRQHVGAVGIKLLYPESRAIQHIGVTNLKVGPVHKLIGESDEFIHYHGVNRGQWNKVAVTGACLLVKRSLYEQIGGFHESLQVAYNDVDFCMQLLKLGYYNVVCNDLVALHHESHSRGNDIADEGKYERLVQERTLLYERNECYYHVDPYYSKHLIQDADYYGCVSTLPCDQEDYEQIPVQRGAKRLPARNKIHPFHYTEDIIQKDGFVTIQGWSFFHEVDNACYETYLVLENEENRIWSFFVEPKYRLDVTKLVENQIHNELSGMIVRFQSSILPKGTYYILLKKKNKITKEVQYIPTGKQLEIQ